MGIRRLKPLALAVAVWAPAICARAQNAVPPVSVSPSAPPIAAAAGTLIEIQIDDHLNSKTAKSGDVFRLHLASPIVLDGKIAASAGAVGAGEVIDAAGAGLGGRPGELSLAVRYLDFGQQRVRIGHLRYGRTGQNNDGAAMAAGVAVGLVGYLIKGGNVDVPAGTIAAARLTDPLRASQSPAASTSPVPTLSANSTPTNQDSHP